MDPHVLNGFRNHRVWLCHSITIFTAANFITIISQFYSNIACHKVLLTGTAKFAGSGVTYQEMELKGQLNSLVQEPLKCEQVVEYLA